MNADTVKPQATEATPASAQAISAELQQSIDQFETAKAEYVELQAYFTEITSERTRLIDAAAALDSEAAQANTTWKNHARERHVDQRKVNAEINREATLKQQAETMRYTASVRVELENTVIVKMAKARFSLSSMADNINLRGRDERLAELMATPGLGQTLQEIFAICRTRFISGLDQISALPFRGHNGTERGLWQEFGDAVRKHLGFALGHGTAPILVEVPIAVRSEVVARTMVGLRKLEQANGAIPDDVASDGANFGPCKLLTRA